MRFHHPAVPFLALTLMATGAVAEDATPAAAVVATVATEDGVAEAKPPLTRTTVCALIDQAAATHRLPVEFFTRLIWKESRFRQDALSPKGAQGIAQFMPGTAALRGLEDAYDPMQAIPASAHYLRDLADRFGNLGLAAAAYNAGEKRVSDWRAGTGGLPYETRDYVVSITGRSAEEWNAPGVQDKPPERGLPPDERPPGTCLGVAALLGKRGGAMAVVANYPKADWAPWGVQVAGNFSLNRAMASYATLQNRHSEILGAQPPMVVRTFNRSRGSAPVFQLRVPAQSRDEAGDICGRLKRAGAACVVMRTAE
ncbi:MAG: lytic transglycosylase domain-containing protein [Bauldia sp.]|nr:lytic transglycosylase domain-containing protein [Bauldia sp.]